MMENEKTRTLPIGVRIFIGIYSLVACYYFAYFLRDLYLLMTGDFSNTVTVYDSYAENYRFFFFCALYELFKTAVPLTSAILLFKLRRWGYRIIWLQLLIPFVPENIVLIFHAVYFSRRKVRQNFN